MRGRSALVAAVVFVAAIGWLLAPSLLGTKVLSPADLALFGPPFRSVKPPALMRPANPVLGDAAFDFEPDLIEARAQVRAGSLPVWDELVGAGRPLLASQQAAPLYPPNGLAYVISFWRALGWIGALKLLIACLGAFALCRALGLGLAASLLGGVGFGLGDAMIVFLSHPHTAVGGLLPWCLLFVERLARGPRPGAVAGLAVSLGLAFLGGHPETALVLATAVVGYALFAVTLQRHRAWRRSAAAIALGLLLGAAIGAISILPFFELLAHGGHLSRAGPADPLKMLAGMFFPELWGRPDKVTFAGGPAGGFAGSALYVGALPLLLAAGGLVRPSPHQWLFLGMALAAVLLMLDTPLRSELQSVPGLSDLDFHWFFWWLILALAVLGAAGAQRLLSIDVSARQRMLLVIASVTAVVIAWPMRHSALLSRLGSAFGQLPSVSASEHSPDVVRMASILRFGLLAAFLIVAGALLIRSRWGRVLVGPLIVLVCAVDVLSIDAGFQPQIPQAYASPPAVASIRYLLHHAAGGTIIGSGSAMPPNTSERYGLRDARALDLPELRRHAELFNVLGGMSLTGLGDELFDVHAPNARRLLDVFAVRYVIDGETGPAPRGLRIRYEQPGQRVLENPSALPRAWVAYDWRTANGVDEALRLTEQSDVRSLEHDPVLEHAPTAPAAPAAPPTTASIRQDAGGEVTIDATARQAGYLVLEDSFYPGWSAELDGHAVSILAANEAFRAVPIPAGRHRIRFHYAPTSVFLGTILTLLGIAAAAGLLIIAARERRPRQAGPAPALRGKRAR